MQIIANTTSVVPADGTGRSNGNQPPPDDASFWAKWKWRLTRQSWWHLSYLLDYVLVVVLFILGGVVFTRVQPFRRFVPANDPSLSYPHKDEIVPVWAVIVFAIGGPIIIFLTYQVGFIYIIPHQFTG